MDESGRTYNGGINVRKLIKWAVIILLAIILLTSTIGSVPAGNVGVTITMGSVSDNIKEAGPFLKVPFIQTVKMMDVKTQKVEWANSQAPITAASKDLQDVFMLAVVTYHISPKSAATVYKEVGMDYEAKIVIPLSLNAIKTHTAKYNVAETLQNREKITRDVNDDLRVQLAKYNIILENASLINIDFRKEYKDAIEQKQIAEKQVETQQFTLNKQALEAQQQVKKAEADKQAKILAAEAEKQSKILEGQGIEAFNKSVTESITPELLQYKALQNQEAAIAKWSGEYPTTVAGGGSVPLIQIPGGAGASAKAPSAEAGN